MTRRAGRGELSRLNVQPKFKKKKKRKATLPVKQARVGYRFGRCRLNVGIEFTSDDGSELTKITIQSFPNFSLSHLEVSCDQQDATGNKV